MGFVQMQRYGIQLLTRPAAAAAFHHLRTLSSLAPFSNHRQSKTEFKALRIRDIVSPRITTDRHSHLRLIQEFLQKDSDPSHFPTCSSSSRGFQDVPQASSDSNTPITDLGNEGVGIDVVFLSNALTSYGELRNIRAGVQYHCLATKAGFLVNLYVGSALVSLYAKCGKIENAYRVFEEMSVRNVVSWTAIIAAFAQEWQVDVCLELYGAMRSLMFKPNDFTLTTVLSACTGAGALAQGTSAHCQTIRMGFHTHIHIANALISMYCKCGSVKDALCIFESMADKDIVSWNSMIAGYARHGFAAEVIELFNQMSKERVEPDTITFLGLLSSCRHAGLVEQGRHFFSLMVEHGMKPALGHYSCIVDLLGHVGLLKEARELIRNMPMHPNAVIWGSLLSSCRLHGNVWIGIEAAERRLLLEPGCAATHVQLANLYSSIRSWDQAARVRKLMKDNGLKTNPGCSWIQIKNEVFMFGAEDTTNIRVSEILLVVDYLVNHMRALGCALEMHEEENDVGS